MDLHLAKEYRWGFLPTEGIAQRRFYGKCKGINLLKLRG
jgi:hypothetical protein